MTHSCLRLFVTLLVFSVSPLRAEPTPRLFQAMDVFELEWVSDPQISPDGRQVAYMRWHLDVMKDKRVGEIWLASADGKRDRPLLTGQGVGSPRWSPDGERLAYVASVADKAQIFVRHMDEGDIAQVTRLTKGPDAIAWSPDGTQIAFVMAVASKAKPMVESPEKPEGAEWAAAPKVIEKMIYRADGAGYLPDEHAQLFVVPAEGGTPRQLTTGDFDHGGAPAWTPDSAAIVISANRHEGWERDPNDSDLFEVSVADGALRQLTTRHGPDQAPAVSPDGRYIAFTGYDDTYQGYETSRLSLLDRATGVSRVLAPALDRSVQAVSWSADSRELFSLHEDHGLVKLVGIALDGKLRTIATDLAGDSLGRPYTGGDFSLSRGGAIAYTGGGPRDLANLSVIPARSRGAKVLTSLNRDIFGQRDLASLEEITFKSSHDGWPLQGWILRPAGSSPEKKLPLVLEIHGGPFAQYGPMFSSELELYAAAGHVVLYMNPRGSTGYGKEFGNAIHHAYPGFDYDDLMSGVDAVIAKGGIDESRLFVTGGSGGGVLSAWIVGKTDRFRAAVVQKPVINWMSFALTSDEYGYYHRYWFSKPPWEDPQQYLARSPLMLVGNVKTPTMVITGEVDYRTPMSESEQYYQALQIRGIPAALVRVPDAGHGLDARPSQLISKVAHVLAWFKKHDATTEAP